MVSVPKPSFSLSLLSVVSADFSSFSSLHCTWLTLHCKPFSSHWNALIQKGGDPIRLIEVQRQVMPQRWDIYWKIQQAVLLSLGEACQYQERMWYGYPCTSGTIHPAAVMQRDTLASDPLDHSSRRLLSWFHSSSSHMVCRVQIKAVP